MVECHHTISRVQITLCPAKSQGSSFLLIGVDVSISVRAPPVLEPEQMYWLKWYKSLLRGTSKSHTLIVLLLTQQNVAFWLILFKWSLAAWIYKHLHSLYAWNWMKPYISNEKLRIYFKRLSFWVFHLWH